MADRTNSYAAARWALVLLVALVIAGVLAWRAGVFQGPPPNTREVYKADVKDESGGSFIVTDSSTPGVPVKVPETRMHDVPATPSPQANASPTAK
jgi:hypothetical protein